MLVEGHLRTLAQASPSRLRLVDAHDYKQVRDRLAEAGFRESAARYDASAFGSWGVSMEHEPPLRVVWDGKERWLLVQREGAVESGRMSGSPRPRRTRLRTGSSARSPHPDSEVARGTFPNWPSQQPPPLAASVDLPIVSLLTSGRCLSDGAAARAATGEPESFSPPARVADRRSPMRARAFGEWHSGASR
jgi:hypothetical protein